MDGPEDDATDCGGEKGITYIIPYGNYVSLLLFLLRMSIQLAWDALIQTSLSSTLVELINKRLLAIDRPSFIGPVAITSFEFGTSSPDIELVDIRDIYPDFLEDDDEVEQPLKQEDVLAELQWASREGAGLTEGAMRPPPPQHRYGQSSKIDPFGNIQPPVDIWKDKSPVSINLSQEESRRPFMSALSPTDSASSSVPQYSTRITSPNDAPKPSSDGTDASQTSLVDRPDVQLHFRVTYESNMRLTLTTSFIVNYPSPSFMTLPMKLSITGFIFTGEVVVAYEGHGQRLHLCIVDDLDPYGLSGTKSSQSSVYSDQPFNEPGIPTSEKPLPAGIRLLPSIFIESEVGQTDKHVLKNGTRVERFIQDVLRKTLEEELLFPNYHTILLEG